MSTSNIDVKKYICERCLFLISNFNDDPSGIHKEDALKYPTRPDCNYCFGLFDFEKYKELISERSQSNKLVQQNDVVSNNDLIKVNQNNNQLNDEELQKSKNNSNSSSFNIDALELEQLMGDYKERGKDYKDLKYFEKKPVSQLISELKSDPDNGITSIEDREKVFGSNIVYIEPVKPFCYFIWKALDDLMVRILIVAAIVSIVLGCTISEDKSKDWIDGLSIIVAVLVVVLVGSITNYNKELKFHELNEVQSEGTTYKIIRNGKRQFLNSL